MKKKKNISKNSWHTYQVGYPNKFDPEKDSEGYVFEPWRGQLVIDFFEDLPLTHVRGPLKGKPFKLLLWEKSTIGQVYSWWDPVNNCKRFQNVILETPRKNGKSLITAGLSIWEVLCGDPHTPEVIIASSDREASRKMFDTVKLMILQNPMLKERLIILKDKIICEKNHGKIEIISHKPDNQHGGNCSAVFCDEVSHWPMGSGELFDVLQTSTGARKDPITMTLTTASNSRDSWAFKRRALANKVLTSEVENPNLYPAIYEAGKKDAWDSPETLKKCNPSIDVAVSMQYLKKQLLRAKEERTFENVYKSLHLNNYTESFSAYISSVLVNACRAPIDLEELRGQTAYGGLDMASVSDTTCIIWTIPGEPVKTVPRVFIPQGAVEKKSREGFPYAEWVRDYPDEVFVTPGQTTDFDFVYEKIIQDSKFFNIRVIFYDEWSCHHLASMLGKQGIRMIKFIQGIKSYSVALKTLEKFISEKKICLGEGPAIPYALAGAVTKFDINLNYMLDKKNSHTAIDSACGLAMSLEALTQTPVSAYAEHGLRYL